MTKLRHQVVGQMDGLPIGTIVETNARFSSLGVTPVMAGRLPDDLLALVTGHAARQTALRAAVIAARWDGPFDLFHQDPLVAPIDAATARRMFTQMVAATARHLPQDLPGEAA